MNATLDGTYIIRNFKSGKVIDMSGNHDISGYPRNSPDTDNQKWLVKKTGSDPYSYSIQSWYKPNSIPYYLAPASTSPTDKTAVIASGKPFSWNIYPYDGGSFWRIFMPGSSPGLNFDLEGYGCGSVVQLWYEWEAPASDNPLYDGGHQKWVFEKVSEPPSSSSSFSFWTMPWQSGLCTYYTTSSSPLPTNTTTDPSFKFSTTPPPTTSLSSTTSTSPSITDTSSTSTPPPSIDTSSTSTSPPSTDTSSISTSPPSTNSFSTTSTTTTTPLPIPTFISTSSSSSF